MPMSQPAPISTGANSSGASMTAPGGGVSAWVEVNIITRGPMPARAPIRIAAGAVHVAVLADPGARPDRAARRACRP